MALSSGGEATASSAVAAVRSQLVSAVSVYPSTDWTRSCIEYLQRNRRPASADDVLVQILYSDLRDVVRPPSSQDGFRTAVDAVNGNEHPQNAKENATNEFPPARQLRNAIRASTRATHHYQQILPESFALLCQLEAVTNVAQNAEQRLGGASNTIPQHRGSSARCWKVCLSDGHSGSSPIMGIESLPIQSLSQGAPEGSKVLLRGPLEVRHGVLVLHPGNFVVLGGCFEALVRHRAKERERARKEAGVGVDPTVRALIGSTGLLMDEEGVSDEAHEASGDVVAQVTNQHQAAAHTGVAPAPQQLQQHQQQRDQQSLGSVSIHHQNTRSDRSPAAAGRKRTASQMSNVFNDNNNGSSSSSSSNTIHNSRASGSMQASFSTNAATTTRATVTARNPYSGSDRAHIGSAANPYQRVNKSQQPPLAPPKRTRTEGARNATKITPIASGHNHRSPNTELVLQNLRNNNNKIETLDALGTAKPQSPAISISKQQSMPSPPHFLYSTISTASSESNLEASSSSRPVSTASSRTIGNKPSLAQNMSFANLRKLLMLLVANRDMYDSYYQRKVVFRVELFVSDPNNFSFDVVKTPRQSKHHGKASPSKKNKKKYEYFTSAFFGANSRSKDCNNSNSDSSLFLACRIHPDLLESCFEVSANELRALSRADRPKCASITNGGGEAVRRTYFAARAWKASLHLPADSIFGGNDLSPEERVRDLKKPVLLLEIEPPS